MDIPINAKATCLEGMCGHSVLVILKPTTQEITHVVISNDSSPETEYLVSIDRIAKSTRDLIHLDCSKEELSKMPVFAKEEFIRAGDSSMIWMYYPLTAAYIMVEKEHIPADELAIRRGARVEASDAHVGRVDEFMYKATHARTVPQDKCRGRDMSMTTNLLIAASPAYIWMICQGLQVIASNQTALIDRTDRVDKSFFRLGLDWIKYALKQGLDFQPIFQFQPLETITHVR